MKNNYFTLIELLVVIAIIAILAANIVIVLAMPSIRAIPRASRWNEVEL